MKAFKNSTPVQSKYSNSKNHIDIVGDAFQKKNSIWRDIVPTSYYPLPPFKSRDKTKRDIFGVLDPPPPLQK